MTSSDAGAGLPATVGRYRVESELGRGMMGVVYKAHDPLMDRSVALKVVRFAFTVDESQRTDFDMRFLAEARIVARLSHPNIVVAHDVGRDGPSGPPFIALEYLQGRTLAQVLADARPDWRVALRLVARLAEALHYAHEQGVVHRDIKPANVMLLPTGEPKLMDFGLAKLRVGLDGAASTSLVGTPLYMAPEQALGREADGRSDLFSLGSLAYTLLTGRRAFEADSVPRILQRVAFDEPARPTRVQRDLPASLDYVLARALAKDPAARYANGRLLAEDCDDVLHLRPPRHRARWTPAPTPLGERTQASPAPRGSQSIDGDGGSTLASPTTIQVDAPVPARAPLPRHRTSRLPLTLLGLGMLVSGAGLFASVSWRQSLAAWLGVAPSSPATAAPSVVAPTATTAPPLSTHGASPTTSPAASTEPDAGAERTGEEPTAGAATPEPAPSPEPSGEPGLVAASPASPAPSPAEPSPGVTPSPTPTSTAVPAAGPPAASTTPARTPASSPSPSPSPLVTPTPRTHRRAAPAPSPKPSAE